MSETQDPDKRIVFGIKRKTEGAHVADLPSLIEAPFPSERTIHWTPVLENAPVAAPAAPAEEEEATETESNGDNPPASATTAIVITQEVLLKVSAHVAMTLDHELGGFLLGDRYRCPNTRREYVVIDQYSPAKFTEATEVSLSFTHEAWAQLHEELTGKFRGKLKVGWYHSHPKMDVFLSRYDMEIQRERFPEPWMCALVLEPEKHRGGFFCWRGDNVNPNEPVEFYELLERNSRESVVAWTNYKGTDQFADSELALSKTNTQNYIETPESMVIGGQPASTPIRPPAPRPVPNSAIPNRVGSSRAVPAQAESRSHTTPPKAASGGHLWVLVLVAALLIGFLAVWGVMMLRNRQQESTQEQTQAVASETNSSAAAAAGVASPAEAEEVEALNVNEESIQYKLQPGAKDVLTVSFVINNSPTTDLSVKIGPHDAQLLSDERRPGNSRFLKATADLKREIESMKSRLDTPYPLSLTVADAGDLENRTKFTVFVEPQKLWPNGVEATRPEADEGFRARTEVVERAAPRPRPRAGAGNRRPAEAPRAGQPPPRAVPSVQPVPSASSGRTLKPCTGTPAQQKSKRALKLCL